MMIPAEPYTAPDEPFDAAPWILAYRRMHAAMVQADTDTLRGLISQAFMLIHMTGYAQTGAEWLQHIESGKMRYFSSVEEALLLRGAGGKHWLCGQNQVRANIWGARGTWRLQMEVEFRMHQGIWLMSKATASTY